LGNVRELKCVICGKTYLAREVDYTCPACGLDGTLDVLYDYDEPKRLVTREKLAKNCDLSMWGYLPLLPVEPPNWINRLSCGWTPLYDCRVLADEYGIKKVYVKDETRNPTGSLKDRASAVGVAKALSRRCKTVVCASTGNAASSLSAFAAVGGLKSFIFVPESIPVAKLTQLLVYGSYVILVKGDYEAAFNLSMKAADRYGWYNRNCGVNPYLVEGKKTVALEIAEQLLWDVPDYVFVAVGDGCCISGLYKGFSDLKMLGFIDQVPRLVGVQAEGCMPIHEAIQSNSSKVRFVKANTIADSIAVGAPRNWAKALRAIRNSNGTTVTVRDAEILQAMRYLAQKTGIFGEPAGVAGFAGFQKMARLGKIESSARVVVVVTGSGLKDIASARKATSDPLIVDPDSDELWDILSVYGQTAS